MLAAVTELPSAAAVGGEFAVLESAAAGLAAAHLQAPQPKPLLQLPARLLGAGAVVVQRLPCSVLGDERDDRPPWNVTSPGVGGAPPAVAITPAKDDEETLMALTLASWQSRSAGSDRERCRLWGAAGARRRCPQSAAPRRKQPRSTPARVAVAGCSRDRSSHEAAGPPSVRWSLVCGRLRTSRRLERFGRP